MSKATFATFCTAHPKIQVLCEMDDYDKGCPECRAEKAEAQLKTVTAERDYSDVCGAQFEQEIRNLKKQLDEETKLKQDYYEQCGVLSDIINKARVDPNADQSCDSAIDNSYTGQIAQLQAQLEAVRDLFPMAKSKARSFVWIHEIEAAIGEDK